MTSEMLNSLNIETPDSAAEYPDIPPTACTKNCFNTIRQGTATNTLTKMKATPQNTSTNSAKTAKVTQGDLTVTIPKFEKLTGLRISTYQLLDALTVKLTETGAKSPVVELPLTDYMEKRGLKNWREAKKQVANDLEVLFNATISFKDTKKDGKEQNFLDIRIIDGKGIKNGIITVSFGTVFYGILLSYPIMPYPVQLWEINGKHNPSSFYLLRRIAEHKNMNVGKKNEDIISVKTLLAATPNIPSYDVVMAKDRALSRRIVEPFERDMNALRDTLTWTYCHSSSQPLTNEELSNFSYQIFIKLLIKIDWKSYPDQSARLKRKAARIEQAKQRKDKNKAMAAQEDKADVR